MWIKVQYNCLHDSFEKDKKQLGIWLMLNDYIISSFYLYQLSQNTWPLWIYYFSSKYTIIGVSLPKHSSLPFWNQKAFPHNSYWLVFCVLW